MSKQEYLMIYPYNIEATPLLRSKKFIKKYPNIILCALKGSGLDGKSADYADGGTHIDILVSEDFESSFQKCTSILFVDSLHIKMDNEDMQKKINLAVSKDINVIDLRHSVDDTADGNEITSLYGAFVKNKKIALTKNIIREFEYSELLKSEGLLDITTPIICAAGTSENTNKLTVQISMVERLEALGYKVSWIGSNNLCEMIGGHRFPEFMFKSKINNAERILLFNRYIKHIESTDKVDVIVVGIPGGIMPCSKNIVGDFGVLAYMVLQGIIPDYFVLNIYYDDYRDNFFEEIKNHVKYTFSSDLDMINICNRRVDWLEAKLLNDNVVPYYTVNLEHVDKLISKTKEKTKIKMINIFNESSQEYLLNDILDQLADDEPNIVF